MVNWKAAGPDLVQGYWFKKQTGIHTRLQQYLKDCVRVSSGMVAQKNRKIGNSGLRK